MLLLRCCFSIVLLNVVVSLSTPIPTSCDGGALYFGHLFTSTNGLGVSQAEKAVQLAVEAISSAIPLLSYKLNYTASESKAST